MMCITSTSGICSRRILGFGHGFYSIDAVPYPDYLACYACARHTAKAVPMMPTRGEIEASCADAILSYRRYEHKRIILPFAVLAVLFVLSIIGYVVTHL